MKGYFRFVYLLLVLPFFGIQTLQAQPLYYLIDEEAVKPGMEEQYRAAAKERANQAKEDRFGYTVHAARLESRYFYFIPLKGMAEFDEFMKEYQSFVEKNRDLWNRIDSTLQERNSSLALFRADLQYQAENPRHSLQDVNAIRFIVMRPKMDKVQELESSLKDFTNLLQENKISDSHYVLQQVVGRETPKFLIAYLGKDAEDLTAINRERDEKLGESGKTLGQKAEPLVESLDAYTLQVEHDLDHQPEEQ